MQGVGLAHGHEGRAILGGEAGSADHHAWRTGGRRRPYIHTVAALNRAGVAGDFSYVSTAGGAFLEWLEGKTLPGVAALEAAA